MDAREFAEWQAFDRIDPLPDRRLDLHMAAQTAAQMNAAAPRRDGRVWRVDDFMLFQERAPAAPAMTVGQDLLAAMRAYSEGRADVG